MDAVDQPAYERQLTAARRQLPAARWARAWAEGQALTLEQAIAEALEDQSGSLMPEANTGVAQSDAEAERAVIDEWRGCRATALVS